MHDYDYVQKSSKSKKSFGRKKSKDSTNISDKVNRNVITAEGGTFSLTSKGDNHNTSPEIHAHEHVELLSTEGKVILESDKSTEQHVKNKSGSNFAWQKAKGNGSVDETVEEPVMDTSKLTAEGALGTELSLKARGNLEQTLAALSQDPNMAWAAELAKDPAVQVHLLKEYHKHWDYKQSGLTPGGAAIIALAVAIATAGAGSAISAGVAGAAGSAGASAGTAAWAGAASKAAFMSLVSSASVSLVNNKGNVHLVLKELSSKEQMRSLAVAILTANTASSGPLDQINMDTVLNKAQGIVVDSAYKAGVQTAIMGGKFGDHFKQTVQTAGVNAVADQVVDAIGQRYHASEEANAIEAAHPNLATENPELAAKLKAVPRMNPLVHLGAHAVTGAGTAALKGESKELGAIGAALGEFGAMAYKKIASENLAPGEALNKETGVNVAKFVAGTAAVLVTGGQKDVSIAIDTAGRAAEFNTLSGQERIKEWNEEQEKEKEKLARRLVKQGIVSQEVMDQAYDSLTLVDLEEIRADHRRAVSKDTKGLGEMSYDAHKEGRQAQFDVLRGDLQLEKITKATSTLATDLTLRGQIYHLVEAIDFLNGFAKSEEKPTTSTLPQKWSLRSPYDVDPSEPFQSKEHERNAIKLMSAINPHSPTQFEYAAAYSGHIKNPEDFRNLAPGAEYFKIVGDKKDRFSAKWGGKTRNGSQKLALNVTGNPHVAVTAGFGGALALDLVADPMNAAGGAGKIAQAGKAVIKGASGARAISRAAQGGAGFADAVAAAKQGASLSGRTAANVTSGKAVAQTTVHQAEQATVYQAQKSLARDIDLRVKPKGLDGVDVKKGEQPWTIREGQEWKNKIIGKAQKTGTEGHSFASYREAIKQAKKEEVEAVLMNRGYNRLVEPEFGFKISPNRRPDVLVKTTDGKIHAYEVPSKSDKIPDLEFRNDESRGYIPEMSRGEFDFRYIKKAPEGGQ